ncbi:interleukin-27 receptor subunit alpha isoform X4 [Symphalangus syndactylus]|uniref:interleukin-27 receptor subunit alpha isoform X4 n=1 Tax=Symphalangus syndactylus TaxID=9590 RepID=UPI003004106F
MWGGRGAPFWPWPLPKLALLPLLWMLFQRTRPQGSAGPLQCYGVGPLGDLNCSWEPLGDLGAPSELHLQSQKYHCNKTQTVAVAARRSWVAIPREQLTVSDKLLVWGTKAGQPLWPPVFVNLETQMKPNAPRLGPDVDFSEDDPLEATVHWAPPTWPSHKVLICQFHYRRCQEAAWTLAPGPCVQVSYKVWFWVGGRELNPEGITCCCSLIPSGAEWARVSAVNATSWEPLTNLSLVCLDSASAPHSVAVSSIAGSTELLVTWRPGPGEPREHVVDWARDGDPLEKLNWVRLPPGNLSALLPENFTVGVPYRITVTAVSASGLASAPSIWGFREELAPLVGPTLWRLQDAPPGTPVIAWGEVPRHQLRGHLTHYTLCAQSGTSPSVCMNDNTLRWKVLPGVLFLWGLFLMGCGLSLATSGRCYHLRHKVLPRWVWEKVPDPANSSSGQPHMEQVPEAQPLGDLPILEVEEMEPPPVMESSQPPQATGHLDSGYEKHFLPTPEELGLLGPARPQVLA